MKDFHVGLITREYSDQYKYDGDTVSTNVVTVNRSLEELDTNTRTANASISSRPCAAASSTMMDCMAASEDTETKLVEQRKREDHYHHSKGSFFNKSDTIRNVTSAATAKWKQTISDAYKRYVY